MRACGFYAEHARAEMRTYVPDVARGTVRASLARVPQGTADWVSGILGWIVRQGGDRMHASSVSPAFSRGLRRVADRIARAVGARTCRRPGARPATPKPRGERCVRAAAFPQGGLPPSPDARHPPRPSGGAEARSPGRSSRRSGGGKHDQKFSAESRLPIGLPSRLERPARRGRRHVRTRSYIPE